MTSPEPRLTDHARPGGRRAGSGRPGIPAGAEIRALHERHAPTPEAFDLVYTHCLIVCGIAEQSHARRAPGTDLGLVRAGCLLHDIGVYRLYDGAGETGAGPDDEVYGGRGVTGIRVGYRSEQPAGLQPAPAVRLVEDVTRLPEGAL